MGIWGMEYTQKENELSFDHFSFVLPYFYTKTRLISSKYNCSEPKTRILTVIKLKIGPLLLFLYIFPFSFQSPLLRLWRIVQEFFTLHCFPTSSPSTFYHRLAFHFFLQPNPPKKRRRFSFVKRSKSRLDPFNTVFFISFSPAVKTNLAHESHTTFARNRQFSRP